MALLEKQAEKWTAAEQLLAIKRCAIRIKTREKVGGLSSKEFSSEITKNCILKVATYSISKGIKEFKGLKLIVEY